MAYQVKKGGAPYLLGTLLMTLTMACGQVDSSQSDLSVTNGQEIGERDYPSTVLLMIQSGRGSSICTATFVNDRQAITANHCVLGQNPSNPTIYYTKVENGVFGPSYRRQAKAVSYHAQSQYSLENNYGVNRYDLAIVNFPARTAPAVSPIAQDTPELESEIVIVGYGNNENYLTDGGASQGGSGSGVKRFGKNELQLIEDGMLAFLGTPSAEDGLNKGEMVSSGSGDSGGPMFVNDELVGVTSGGGLGTLETGETVSISQYVDLNSDESRAFLRRYLLRM
ncbi:MAG: trypsin-like serine protease [Oligoflexus sp.]